MGSRLQTDARSIRHLQRTTAGSHHRRRPGTFEEMLANLKRLATDPEFDPQFNQLSDASLRTDTDLSTDNIRLLYQRRVFSPTSRRAVVAPNPFTYGMARMIQAYVELSNAAMGVKIFRDRASALEWLGTSKEFLRD